MKKASIFLGAFPSYASLTVIGTAHYQGQDYNLIYMDDGPFGPVTWLDYTNGIADWDSQVAWANGLGSELTVTIYPGYSSSVDWSQGWRLPMVDESNLKLSGVFGYEGPDSSGFHDYPHGYNMINGEMNYLYYESLGNKGYYATDGIHPQGGYGLQNTGYFDNLKTLFYWSGTEYSLNSSLAWALNFNFGDQEYFNSKSYIYYGLAVHPGEVSTVPLPRTMLFLVSGLIVLGRCRNLIRRRLHKKFKYIMRKKSRVFADCVSRVAQHFGL